MATGIKDKVAILGMGCSKFGERWDASPEDLMVEAYTEAMADAGIVPEQLDAAWFSTHMDDVGVGRGGTPMAIALRLPNIGVTRVENFCAGGSEAIRAAVYAVAAGACDRNGLRLGDQALPEPLRQSWRVPVPYGLLHIVRGRRSAPRRHSSPRSR